MTHTALGEIIKLDTRAPLDRSPKKNWVENTGGLPMFIRRIANHVHAKGKAIGHAIAIAVNAVKKMCASGDVNFPGKQNVNAGSRAEACNAVRQWEQKKAAARVSKGIVGRKWSDDEFIAFLTNETDISKQFDVSSYPEVSKQGFKPGQKRGPGGTWVRTNGKGDKNLGDKYHKGKKVKTQDKNEKASENHAGARYKAGSDVKGGAKRDKSFGLPEGAKTGSWRRIVGSGKAGVSRDTKVGVMTMKNGKTAVFIRAHGKTKKVGEYDDPKQASKVAAGSLRRHMNDETYAPKKHKKKKSSGSFSSSSSSSTPTSTSRPSTKSVTKPKKTKKKTGSQKAASIARGKGAAVGGKVAKRSEVDFELVGEIEKTDDDKHLVFGWFSVAKHADGTVEVDKQGDVLEDIDQMEHVAYDFVLHSRDGGEMHVRKGVSKLVESFVSTHEKWEAMGIPEGILPVGWWGGFKVENEEVWKAVKSGKYKMFSVHGTGMRKALEDAA